VRAGRTSSTARAFAGDPPSDFRAAEGFLERKPMAGALAPGLGSEIINVSTLVFDWSSRRRGPLPSWGSHVAPASLDVSWHAWAHRSTACP